MKIDEIKGQIYKCSNLISFIKHFGFNCAQYFEWSLTIINKTYLPNFLSSRN